MISNHPAFPWPKGMIYVDWCYSIQVIYFSTVMETSNYLHAVLYQRPFKIKSLNISLNGYVFLLGATLMNMMCNRAFYSDSADPIVAVAVRSTVFLNFQIELPRVIQVQWIQVMDLPPQVPHVSSGVRLLDWLVVQQDVHSTMASGLTCAQL